MPPFAAKIIFGLAAVPILMAIFVIILLVFNAGMLAVCLANAVCGLLAIAGWIALWRSTVVWTPARVRDTAMSIGLSVVVALVAAEFAPGPGPEPAAMAGGLFGGGIWILLSTWFWRQTPEERVAAARSTTSHEPIACPICGYDLAGLYEARCPECGTRYTLDELIRAAKRSSDVDELAPR